MNRSFFSGILLFTLIAGTLQSASPDPVFAEHGMVVSATDQASLAGITMLKKGGNAVDAAVATAFALAVTYPQAGNLGGGGFMVTHLADGTDFTLDFREMAPQGAFRDMYLDSTGNVAEGRSLYTHLAAGVPGSVAGLLKAFQDHGSGNLSLKEVLAPAIKLARKGFRISSGLARTLNVFHDYFIRNQSAAEIFIRSDGRPWKAGDRLIQKDLARTLKYIAKSGREGFYSGPVAEKVAAEMKRGGGLITAADMARYEAKYREPVRGTYDSLEVLSMGPPSSGGALLIQMLNMLEAIPLDSLGWNSSQYIHYLTEAERRAYADRAEHMGDPDFWDVPLKMLLSKDYAAKRMATVSPDTATPSAQVFAGDPLPYESRETTHFSVVDQAGNAVSVTTTLNTSFGCGVVVRGAGFFLNNEMDDFAAKPGVPNVYGLVGKEANAVQPGKRPLSSMTPTIVLKAGKPWLVVGTPGGSTIITSVMQVILNCAEFNMDVEAAVAAPRVHSQWLPDVIMTEPNGLVKDVRVNLQRMGHQIIPYRWGYIGQVNAIRVTSDGLYGGSDVRGENAAVGY
ncbi:MAG: gamma-glutamyltransferase [FCB group bacterium]|nr:gamma-glutamyltransferase [FCB group bacterium]